MFEIIDRDASARIGRLQTAHGSITTPILLPVLNPNKLIITPKELEKEFKVKAFIANAYILWKSQKTEDAHKIFSWDKPIMCDSGAYQMMVGKKIELANKDVIKIQEALRPDIAVFLDIPTGDLNYKQAKKTVTETIKNAKECKRLVKEKNILWSAGIQGGVHSDLLGKCAKELGKLDFDVYAIGSVVPRLMRYEFKEVCEQIITAEQNLPLNKPRHLFGAGHPNFLALAVALGCDIFDCAIYALAAEDGRYLTVHGTHNIEDIKEFPCSCPVCAKADPEEVKKLEKLERERFLARHNLYVSFQEIRTIHQAIRENWLWELVQERARSHPKLLEALMFTLKKYGKWLVQFEPVSKKSALFWTGKESDYRPEVIRAKEWLKRTKGKKYFKKKPFGRIPLELKGVYPFGQSVVPFSKEVKEIAKPEDIVRVTLDYQFGKGAGKSIKKINIELSRKTGRIRRVWKDKTLLGTIRSEDGFFLPSLTGADLLKKHMKRVLIKDKEVVSLIKQGKSVFAKFIEKADDVLPGEEVSVSDGKSIIAVGQALLNSKEIKEFERGIAVKVRDYNP